ncbi:MAG: hypothetical protein JSR79_12970, partial [Proteobacteria bacterium]|nr:hypothetical protein [Pseudomonadota bacterium]
LATSGATIRHFFNLKNAGVSRPWVLGIGVMVFYIVAALNQESKPAAAAAGAPPSYADIRALIDRHCSMCHAASPTHPGVSAAPNGAIFDSEEALRRHAQQIYARAVLTHNMPLGNETGMTPAERARLGAWLQAGTKGD